MRIHPIGMGGVGAALLLIGAALTVVGELRGHRDTLLVRGQAAQVFDLAHELGARRRGADRR